MGILVANYNFYIPGYILEVIYLHLLFIILYYIFIYLLYLISWFFTKNIDTYQNYSYVSCTYWCTVVAMKREKDSVYHN